MATYGEKIVRVNFNASGDDQITKAKQQFAQLIDDAWNIHEKKHKFVKSRQDASQEEIDRYSSENLDNSVLLVQTQQLINLLEQASMLYVKLLTAP